MNPLLLAAMWTIKQARNRYSLPYWGEGYVDINTQGNLVVRPRRDQRQVDLRELAGACQDQGLSLPVLVRFNDILHDRVAGLVAAFRDAAAQHDFKGVYTAVYPIKVNQQRTVVDEILATEGASVGLEAGSKPELMAVLALAKPGDLVVCNGYKDREYIQLALTGLRLGYRVHIVVEKLSELELIAQAAQQLCIEPLLGVRIRLASIGAGKWQNSGGEKAKFGLSARQVLTLIEWLGDRGQLSRLRLLHCHLGSQVANIRDIQRGMHEVARYYAELRDMGAALEIVDVGGGLGVDYEGTHSRSHCSRNYSLEEYANNVVATLAAMCTEKALPHPAIVTEAGRAMTAHHAVLITNVIDVETPPGAELPISPGDDEPPVVKTLWEVLQQLNGRNVLEAWHDAEYWLAEARTMYLHGLLTLEQRARVETLYFSICHRVQPLLKIGRPEHREILDRLNEQLADKYFLNLSVFQSLPDVWAIDQIFPIVPVQRLDDPPTRRAILQDLTCDSDGRISQYVDAEGVESTLPVHRYQPGDQYLLGVFLVGAYQEILGDMHNLFGDTDAVNIRLTAAGFELTEPEQGDTIDELLRYVHFDTDAMLSVYRQRLEATDLAEVEQEQLFARLKDSLSGYTYLED